MSPDHTARRSRARYIEALKAIPLPVRYTDPSDPPLPIDLAGLPVLATETVAERQVRFSLIVGQTRFRLTFTDTHPNLIGSVINLSATRARLVIAGPLHTEWALANEPALIDHAIRIWNADTRTCNR